MTDLPTRLLAAITEVEQREGIKVQLGLTEPSLLLSLCAAHQKIVEHYRVGSMHLEYAEHRMLREGQHDDRLQNERATWGARVSALYLVLELLARGYGLNPEENTDA